MRVRVPRYAQKNNFKNQKKYLYICNAYKYRMKNNINIPVNNSDLVSTIPLSICFVGRNFNF